MEQKLFNKNFILLILGQASSLFGNFILKLALSMYVLETTGSAAIFAGILAVSTIPMILLSPLGGILADRANRRNIMVTLDTLTGISVLGAALLLSKGNAIAVITVLLVLLSILGAFETPTVQSCVPQMQTGDNIIRGNTVVYQIASISALIAPILGSVLYVSFGLKPVMYASIICFFLTAALECFIKLEYIRQDNHEGFFCIVKNDFTESMRFICKEQPCILRMLLSVASISFFVMGTAMVGLPYIVRTILGLNAEYYGFAESALGIAALVGGIAAGIIVGKLKIQKLYLVLAAMGICLIPAGAVFLFPVSVLTKYIVNVASFCGMQIASMVYSIFAVSVIQQKTPNRLIGKVTAYTATITMCTHPLGQMAYGLLFDRFSSAVYIVLIPTGIIIFVIGLLTKGFFADFEKEQTALK